jgi:hypothetical protein
VAIVHRRDQRVRSGPTTPWCRLPRVCLTGHTVVGLTLSLLDNHKGGKVSSNSATHVATHFVGHHESWMCQYTTQSFFIWTLPTRALIDTGGGYHLRAPNFRSDHSSSFSSSILHFPLIAPPSLQLCQHSLSSC